MHLFWTNFHGHSVKYSPFYYPNEAYIAVATAQYYGVAGNGRLHVLSLNESGFKSIRKFDTPEGIYDCAFNELNERQVVVGCCDGSIRLFDIASTDGYPILKYEEHSGEVPCVTWSPIDKNFFLSASWDGTLKVFDPTVTHSISTFIGHEGSVYSAEWHPKWSKKFASVSQDRTVSIWDVNSPVNALSFLGSTREILSCDWNKYREFELVTGSTDGMICVWDIRSTMQPLKIIAGHKLPIRRLRCNPHDPDLLATVSYDLSLAMWNINPVDTPEGPLISRSNHHREFVCGVDFDLFRQGQIVSCAWDQSVIGWNFRKGSPPIVPA